MNMTFAIMVTVNLGVVPFAPVFVRYLLCIILVLIILIITVFGITLALLFGRCYGYPVNDMAVATVHIKALLPSDYNLYEGV